MNATVLLADDDRSVRTVVSEALTRKGYTVKATSNASTLWDWVLDGEGDVVLTDVFLLDENGLDLIPRIKRRRPQLNVIAMSAQNTMATAVRASERGAFDYIAKPFDLDALIHTIERAIIPRDIKQDDAQIKLDEQPLLVGRSAVMQKIYRTLSRISQSDLPVLITGPAGSGKKTLARAIHEHSRRAKAPFMMVGISHLGADYAEDLFGTVERPGRLSAASNGTLVLNDAADMPKSLQLSLLDILETGDYLPVGGRRRLRFDSRLISISSTDASTLLDEEKLRAELFYRLGVVSIAMPPLRDRLEDIPELSRHLLARLAAGGMPKCQIMSDAFGRMQTYDWPGNVRELDNVLRNLCVLAADHIIDVSLVDQVLARQSITPKHAPAAPVSESLSDSVAQHLEIYFSAHQGRLPPDGLYDRILAEIERPLISRCLQACHGNQIKAAELLGLNRNTLRKKIRELGITVRRGSEPVLRSVA